MVQTNGELAANSGVELYCSADIDVARVYALTAAFAERYEATADEGANTLVFATDGDTATIAVQEGAAERPGLEELLGTKVARRFRLSVSARPSAVEARVRAEATLVAALAAIEAHWPVVVVDDNGAIYDPREIAMLAAQNETRGAAFSYQLAESRRAAGEAAPPADEFPETNTRDLPSPVDPLPDARAQRGLIFGFDEPMLPLVDTMRALMAHANDPRSNPDGLPVAVLGENLDATDVNVLRAFGLSVATSDPELHVLVGEPAKAPEGTVRIEAIRDELLVFFPAEVPLDQAHALVDAYCSELAVTSGLFEDPIAGVTANSVRFGRDTVMDAPLLIGAIRAPGIAVDVLFLDAALGLPQLRAVARRRLMQAPGMEAAPTLLAIELRAADVDAYSRADAFATGLCAFLSEAGAVVIDSEGAVFGPNELRRLASVRRGRSLSWTARLVELKLDRGVPLSMVTA